MKKGKKRWKKRTGRLTALLVGFAMLVTMVPLSSLKAHGAGTDSTDDLRKVSDTSEVFAVQTEKPKELDRYPDDVYGVDAEPVKEGEENDNTPFLLSEQNELQFYFCAGVGEDEKSFSIFNSLISQPFRAIRFNKLPENEEQIGLNPNDKGLIGVNKYADPSASELDKSNLKTYREMSFAQGIGFDADGTGRKEYTAIVGLKDKKITLIIQKAKDLSGTREYELGDAQWMYDLNTIRDSLFQNGTEFMDNYFSITAGDYDADGKESVMVYACVDGSDPKIVEVGQKEDGSWPDSAKELVKIRDVVTKTDWITSPNEWRFKPAVSLATGDFDGDNYDELAYSAGFYNNSYNIKDGYVNTNYDGMKLEDFATTVGTFDYTEKTGEFKKTSAQWLYSREKNNGASSGKKVVYNLYMLHGGAITAGDVDGDGLDEIVAAGFTSVHSDETGRATATYENAVLKKVDGLCNWDHGAIATSVIEYSGNEYINSGVGTTALNDCFSDNMDFMGEAYWVFPQFSLACAKTNGASQPEDVFISGSIFDFSKGKPEIKYTAPYFEESGGHNYVYDTTKDGASGMIGGVSRYSSYWTWVRNATAGNFTQNVAGREQFVFTSWSMSEQMGGFPQRVFYGAVVGMITGAGYADETAEYSDEVVDFGSAQKYLASPSNTVLNSFSYYGIDSSDAPCCAVFGHRGSTTSKTGAKDPDSGQTVETTCALNTIPIAVDIDNDGILGKFNNKGFIYTDPNVIAVLQAAPYFRELDEAGGYNGYGDTSYAITTGYGTSSTKGDTVGFEVGYAAEGSFPGFKAAFEAGYAMEWSHEFEEAYSVEETKTFHAENQSLVVLTRVPQLVYAYDIYDKKTDSWVTNGYSVRVPLSARYFMLSIDDYNDFVDEYNRYAEQAGEEDRLYKIVEGSDLPAGHEGIPDNYWEVDSQAGHGGKELSGTTQLGYSGGYASYDRTESSESTESESTQHGFHFGLTIQAGSDYPGGEAWAGGYTNLDYGHSTGYSTSKMSAKSQGGQVQNISEGALVDSGAFTKAEVEQYRFRWAFGVWKRQLQAKGSDIPFLGYFVDEVSRPEGPAAITGQATIKVTEGYEEEYVTSPYNIVGIPEPTIAINDIDERITFNSVTRQLTVAPGLPVGNYKVIMRAANKYGVSRFSVLIQVIKSNDHKAADRVAEMINSLNLDDGLNMSLADIQAVNDASNSYAQLTDSQKQYISEAVERRLQLAVRIVNLIFDTGYGEFSEESYRPFVESFTEIEQKLKKYSEGIDLNEFSAEKTEIMYTLERQINILFRGSEGAVISLTKSDLGKDFFQTIKNIIEYYGQAYIKEQGYSEDDVNYLRRDDYDAFYDRVDELDWAVDEINALDPNAPDFDQKYADARRKVLDIINFYFALDDDTKCLIKFKRLIGDYESLLEKYESVVNARSETINNDYQFIQQVVNVENLINDLPTGTDLKAKHEEQVRNAREEYDKLTDEQKALLDPTIVIKLQQSEAVIIERIQNLISISNKAVVELQYTSRTYNGTAFRPSVIVKLNNEYLKEGEDFFVLYQNNKSVGLATVTVVGDNDYSGSVKATFKIYPKKTSLIKVRPAKKALKITWKKQSVQTTGYQIQIALNRSFKKGKKTVTVKKAKTTYKTIKKLKAKKRYYVRIRTYKQAGKTKYYSAWSTVKSAKTKK